MTMPIKADDHHSDDEFVKYHDNEKGTFHFHVLKHLYEDSTH